MTKMDVVIKDVNKKLDGILSYMEIAEQIIESYENRYPDKKDLIHNSFQILCPTNYLNNTYYLNEFPCGTHCKDCGTFWID